MDCALKVDFTTFACIDLLLVVASPMCSATQSRNLPVTNISKYSTANHPIGAFLIHKARTCGTSFPPGYQDCLSRKKRYIAMQSFFKAYTDE